MNVPQPTPTVGDLIREQRAARRITLAALAEQVKCARSYLSLIEHNLRAAPSEEILEKIERALGFAPGRLVQAARWQSTPDEVRREVTALQSTDRIARRLADILGGSGLDEQGRMRGSLDRAYRTGELRRLVESIGESEERGSAGGTPAPQKHGPQEHDPQASIDRELPMQVPLINKVAAGYPADFTDLGYPARVADEYVRAPETQDADAFAARVVGDSMLPEYREGDVVVFSPAREVKSGMDCFARLEPDQQSTFKRVYFEGEGAIRLQPLNPAYPARVVPREEVAGLYAAVSVTRVL